MTRVPDTPISRGSTPLASAFASRGELGISILAGALVAIGLALRGASEHAADALVWTSLAIGMVQGGRAAWAALSHRRYDIDVLMVLAAGLAAGSGHPEDGAMLLFLFTLSGALEERAMRRAAHAIESLHKLMPAQALAWRDGAWVELAPEALVVGDRIRVRPGELVPVDARVSDGSSSLDQAALTGESVPRAVGAGDEVYAGTINLEAPIEAMVSRPASASSFQRVLDLVTQARSRREPTQRVIDRLSQPYAIAVTLASVLAFAALWWAARRPLADAAGTAIALLIVASPCALVIATPTATLSAIGRGARRGVLFKGGDAIERLARIRQACFDKTGTLTTGRLAVDHVAPIDGRDADAVLAVAAALEQDSTHPLARAIVEAARAAGLRVDPLGATTHDAGRGVRATIDGAPARLGKLDYTRSLLGPEAIERAGRAIGDADGRSAVLVASARASGVIVLRDAVRPSAPEMVRGLRAIGVGPLRMLTGDAEAPAGAVARGVGLDAWDAGLMPEDKLRAIERARAQGGPVLVVGDGVNDAPALAAADASVAIGSIGSDSAMESADIVLMGDDLANVPWAIDLARRARGTIRANLAIALGVIAIMACWTLVRGLVAEPMPMLWAVVAHEGSTLLVVANSLRLLAFGPPRLASAPRDR